jgi:hypothetical protein
MFKDYNDDVLYKELLVVCIDSLNKLKTKLDELNCEIATTKDGKLIKDNCNALKKVVNEYIDIMTKLNNGLVGGGLINNYKTKYLKYKTKYIKLKTFNHSF